MSFHKIITDSGLRGLFLSFLAQHVSVAPRDVQRRIKVSKVARELFMIGAVVAFNRALLKS
jgi:hypothetical protein